MYKVCVYPVEQSLCRVLYCTVHDYFTWAFPTDPKVFLQGAQDE